MVPRLRLGTQARRLCLTELLVSNPLINLILAGFWFVIGAALLASQSLYGDQPQFLIPGTKLSIGWLAMCLVVYNVVRWWMRRSYLRRQRDMEETLSRLYRRRPHQNTPVEPDPNFMFTEEPPHGDRPPSS